jgi:hypothetical protein
MTESSARLTEQELNDFNNSVNDLNTKLGSVIANPKAVERLERDFGLINEKETYQLDASSMARVNFVADRINNTQTRHFLREVKQQQQEQQPVAEGAIEAPTRTSAANFISIAPESVHMARIFEAPRVEYAVPTQTFVAAPIVYDPAEEVSFNR